MPVHICPKCVKQFWSAWSGSKYCSRGCVIAARRIKQERQCDQCGKFYLPHDRLRTKFCSRSCANRAMEKNYVTCRACGQTKHMRKPGIYCSLQCAGKVIGFSKRTPVGTERIISLGEGREEEWHVRVDNQSKNWKKNWERKCVLVLEEALGRKLNRMERYMICFLDGNRLNCDITNLSILPYCEDSVFTHLCSSCGKIRVLGTSNRKVSVCDECNRRKICKLTDELVIWLRREYNSVRSYKVLAEKVGLNHHTVRLAVLGVTWKHVPFPES